MSSSSFKYNLGGTESLPPVDGPKLRPFKHRRKPVEFLELLSEAENSTSSGGHGHVFKIRIQGRYYALKVFKFFDVPRARSEILPLYNGRVDDNTFIFHSDPFFAECRAYGRIDELQRERRTKARGTRGTAELAVPCYGFMGLAPDPFEQVMEEKFGVNAWDRSASDLQRPRDQRRPFRCIVKKFMDGPVAIRRPAKMLRDLKALRRAGVYQRDVFVRNYRDGLLLDFSVAWTEPHWTSNILSAGNLERRRDLELYDFDRMLYNDGIRTAVRATRDEDVYEKLRKRRGTAASRQ